MSSNRTRTILNEPHLNTIDTRRDNNVSSNAATKYAIARTLVDERTKGTRRRGKKGTRATLERQGSRVPSHSSTNERTRTRFNDPTTYRSHAAICMPALSVLGYASYRSWPLGPKVVDPADDFDYSFGFPRRKLRGTINRARSYFSVRPGRNRAERDRPAVRNIRCRPACLLRARRFLESVRQNVYVEVLNCLVVESISVGKNVFPR